MLKLTKFKNAVCQLDEIIRVQKPYSSREGMDFLMAYIGVWLQTVQKCTEDRVEKARI